MSEKILQFVKAFFETDASVNCLGVRANGIFGHYEHQPWMGDVRYVNICEDEDSAPLETFSSPLFGEGAGIEGTNDWDGQGMDRVKAALQDPENFWVEFLRPHEIPASADPKIKDAITRGMDDQTKRQITAQICDGLRNRLP